MVFFGGFLFKAFLHAQFIAGSAFLADGGATAHEQFVADDILHDMIFFRLTVIQPGLPDDVIDSFVIYAQIGSEREEKTQDL